VTALEKRLGFRVAPPPLNTACPNQFQRLDDKGRVVTVRPASLAEFQMYALLRAVMPDATP